MHLGYKLGGGGYYLENYLPGIFNLVVEDYSTVRIKAESWTKGWIGSVKGLNYLCDLG